MRRCKKRTLTCQKTRGSGIDRMPLIDRSNVHLNVGGYVNHGQNRRHQLRLVNAAAYRRRLWRRTGNAIGWRIRSAVWRNTPFTALSSRLCQVATPCSQVTCHTTPYTVFVEIVELSLVRTRPTQNSCQIMTFQRARRSRSRRETTRRGDRGVTTPRLQHLVDVDAVF